MDTVKRLPRRATILFFVLAGVLLVACTGAADTNWPGLSVDEQGIVYVAYGPGVLAIDVETNQELWSFTGGENNVAPVYAAPTVADGQVVFGDYGASGGILSPNKKISVYSLDASNGNLSSSAWPVSVVAQDRIVAPALLVGDRIFMGSADNKVFALDANTAQTVWPDPFEAGHSIWGRSAYRDGVLYVPSLDKSVYALAADDGSLLWQTGVEGSVSDKAVRNEDLVYVGSFDQQAYALDAQSGEIAWSAPAEAAVWGAPLYVDGVVYYADLSGNVYAVGAESGELIWQSSGAGHVTAQPVYADGAVYIASAGDPELSPSEREGALIAFDAEDGTELWRQSTSKPLFTTPVISGETIVVAQEDEQTLLVYFNFDGAQTGTFARPTS